MNNQKILVVNLGKDYGGAEKMLLHFCSFFEKDAEVFLCLHPKMRQYFDNKLKNTEIIFLESDGFSYFKIIKELIKIIKKNNISIVYTHGIKTNLIGVILKKVLRVKFFVTIHSDLVYDYNNKLKQLIFLLFEKVIVHSADKTITVSKNLEQKILTRHNVITTTIHNGVMEINDSDMEDYEENETQNLSILFVGRLCKVKNIELLLESLKLLNEKKYAFSCDIVGEGEEKKNLIKLSEDLGLTDRVNFHGFKSNISHFMKKNDVLIMTSLMEGIPMVILEAFSNKKPVISSNVGGVSELITHNRNGILYETNNREELFNILVRCCTYEYDLNTLGENAYKDFLENWNCEKMCEKYYNLFVEEEVIV